MESSTVSSVLVAVKPPNNSDDSKDTAHYVSVTLSLFGIIGNAFVCLVMLRYPKVFKSPTNKLIIHQSILDFLSALVFLLRQVLAASWLPNSIPGSLYCKLWWSDWPQYSMFVSSTYNLVAISLERYFATCKPVSHRDLFSSRRLKFMMASTWVCGWVTQAHLVLVTFQLNDSTCDLSWSSPALQAFGGVCLFGVELVFPLSVIIFAYTKIIFELHMRSRARVDDVNQDARNMLSKANRNVTNTLLVVAIVFAVCWIPTEVNYLLFNLGVNVSFVDNSVNIIVAAVVAVNFFINPVIYCFTYERFQKQVRKMVCRDCLRLHGHPWQDRVEPATTVASTTETMEHNHSTHSGHP